MFTSANWMVKKGNEQEFIDTWKMFAASSGKNMPGTGHAYLLRDTGNRSHFMSFGEWKDLESIKAWRQSAQFNSYMKKFDALCESHQMMTLESVVKTGQLQEVSR